MGADMGKRRLFTSWFRPVDGKHFHPFVWHRHTMWHPPRGRFTRGWHGHVWFRHGHD